MSKRLPKQAICLRLLLNRSLIQLEAFSLYGETCLHSTISILANRHGLEFKRTREPHQHQGGGTAYFTRYRLTDSSKEAARALLKHYSKEVAA